MSANFRQILRLTEDCQHDEQRIDVTSAIHGTLYDTQTIAVLLSKELELEGYKKYYYQYLNIDKHRFIEGKKIFESKNRDIPINRRYYYPVIATDVLNQSICSSSPMFYNMCKSYFDGSEQSLIRIVEKINTKVDKYRLRRMCRYTTENYESSKSMSVEVLSSSLIKEVMSFPEPYNYTEYIERKKEILADKRQFVIIQDNRIVSTAFISDIIENGCNIVVWSDPKYRCRGYGKEVVNACINWCMKRNYIPIYLVEEGNIASHKVAEKMGLRLMNKELIISR